MRIFSKRKDFSNRTQNQNSFPTQQTTSATTSYKLVNQRLDQQKLPLLNPAVYLFKPIDQHSNMPSSEQTPPPSPPPPLPPAPRPRFAVLHQPERIPHFYFPEVNPRPAEAESGSCTTINQAATSPDTTAPASISALAGESVASAANQPTSSWASICLPHQRQSGLSASLRRWDGL